MRKAVEVFVSGLFGMAVVAVVVIMLQGGGTPTPTYPAPNQTMGASLPPAPVYGSGGYAVHSAAAGTASVPASVGGVDSMGGKSTPPPRQQATPAQAGGVTKPVTPSSPPHSPSAGPSGHPTGTPGGGPSPSPSPTQSGPGLLGGLVGGLLGGVLGLL